MMFGVVLARLYVSLRAVAPRAKVRAPTRSRPDRRLSPVPTPTTALDRTRRAVVAVTAVARASSSGASSPEGV